MISLVLTSIAGMGSAFVGNKIYPIKGGAETPPPTPAEVKRITKEAADKAAALASAEVYEIKEAEKAEQESEPSAPPMPAEQPTAPPMPETTTTAPPKTETTTTAPPMPAEQPTAPPMPETTTTAPPPKTEDDLKTLIKTEFGKDDEFANIIVDFIRTPESEWQKIGQTPDELINKFREIVQNTKKDDCPKKLADLCILVNKKFQSILKNSREGGDTNLYGDQTSEAIQLLSNIDKT